VLECHSSESNGYISHLKTAVQSEVAQNSTTDF